jgi:hypothetical protein
MKLRVNLVLLLLVCPAVTLTASDVLTYHNDNARTGQNLGETILTPGNVNSTAFGKLFVVSVDGLVDAQPLVVSAVSLPGQGTHDVLLVATEHASLYAFDADTGTILWQVSLLGSGETPSDDHGCYQVTPEIGITATPVVDRSSGPNGAVYAVTMSKGASGNYFQRLHALDLTTGRELFGGPRMIQVTFPGTGANSSGGNVIFDPGQYKERPGLLLLNHVVYTAWSSHCDQQPYTGWVMGYDEATLGQVSALNLTPNGSDGAVWASGAGPAADANGNIFLLAANGTFDTALDSLGFPTQRDYGNAFLKLSTSVSTLAVADYFNMFDTVSESNADQDLGSGGALVLPDMTDGSGRTRHLAVGAGKDANIYLADRDNMGKFSPADNNALYQELPGALGGPEFGAPAYFNGAIYYGAQGDNLVAFKFSSAKLVATPASRTSLAFGFPGTTPSISANGTTSGIVWAAENGNPAVLHAYDANNLLSELYNSNQAAGGRDQFGAGNKFITPTIANGKVYVGTTSGVGVFGLLASAPADFSLSVAAGSSSIATVTAGQETSYNLALAGMRGFAGAVMLVCSGAPALTTCTASPNPVTLSGTSTANVTVTVRTTARSTTERQPLFPLPPVRTPLVAIVFALLVSSLIVALRWRSGARRQAALALAAVLLLLMALASCGGGGNPGTPVGTYPLTVTGTFVSGSTSLTHRISLTLTVD